MNKTTIILGIHHLQRVLHPSGITNATISKRMLIQGAIHITHKKRMFARHSSFMFGWMLVSLMYTTAVGCQWMIFIIDKMSNQNTLPYDMMVYWAVVVHIATWMVVEGRRSRIWIIIVVL